MIRRPPRSTLFPTRRSSDLTRTIWISRVETTGTSPSALASTSVSARPWLGSKGRSPWAPSSASGQGRSEEHTSELQSLAYLVCRLLLEKKKTTQYRYGDHAY